VASDGRFRVDDVLPGRYTIDCWAGERVPGQLSDLAIFVPDEGIRPLNQPLDLGELELQKY
jgi:hypothetical protein